jgi:RNA ligase
MSFFDKGKKMTDFTEKYKEYSRIHPSKEMSFDILYNGIMKEVEEKFINFSVHPTYKELHIFKYSQKCVMEKHWNVFTLMARGLVIDVKNRIVKATPFIKFFNYNEIFNVKDIVTSSYIVSNKYDGSLIILFNYNDEWITATCGSFISEQAVWAKKWLHENMYVNKLSKENTYLSEVIYPENKIVVNYDFSGLVLLSVYDKFGLEYNRELLEAESGEINLRCAKIFNFDSIEKIIETTKVLDRNHEGYVIRFDNGIRVKLKTDEYIRIHRLISRVTPLAIWEVILHGEDTREIREQLPEEIRNDFDTINTIINNKLSIFIKKVEYLFSKTFHMSDKELGICMQQNPNYFKDKEFKEAKNYIFLMRRGSFYVSLNDFQSPVRQKIFNVFRPTSNKLDGFKDSSISNRFSADN